MRPIVSAELVNGRFGDPALYLDFKFEKRALLFDLGEVAALPPKKVLRITDAFVSHTHMDHFEGFDRVLRLCLGRDLALRLYGPPRFVEQVGCKLAAYTWNKIENYPNDFTLVVHELHPDGRMLVARYRSRGKFVAEPLPERRFLDGVVLDEPRFRVRTAFLDHSIPCLAWALEEKAHINVWKNRLEEMGLPTGPWLKALKDAVADGRPDDTPIRIAWKDADGAHERVHPLGELKAKVLEILPGAKLCYATDILYHEQNERSLAALAAGADPLFIECVFMEEDADHAPRKAHLTARQAGRIARAAGAKSLEPFHFSPRYMEREAEIRAELESAWRGEPIPEQVSKMA